ncbi:hypothetical protein PybrP1_007709 [[Pythium] brassicae (nom. inval.)]|nr:hypothetical protein PybrP1_007709 [[Pythium] brassicae (nom. inval.)]
MSGHAATRAPAVGSRDDDTDGAAVSSSSENVRVGDGSVRAEEEEALSRGQSDAVPRDEDEAAEQRGSRSATASRRHHGRSQRRARRNLFDQYIRSDEHAHGESDNDSERVERESSSDGSESSGGERRHRLTDRRRHKSQRQEPRREIPASRRQRRRCGGAEALGSNKIVADQHARPRSADCSNHEPHDRNRRQTQSDSDNDDGDDGGDAAGLANSGSSQSFVLIDRLPGGRRSGPSSSFSGMFESSLFEVVDAIERSPPSRPAALAGSHSSAAQPSDTHEVEADARVSSSTARLERLLLGMQARERKLARLDQGNEHPRSAAPVPFEGPTNATVDSDFELFNQVKDVYESEFLHHHQQQQLRASRSGSAPILRRSQRDRSVREAVEQDMAELLREQDASSHH